MAKTKTGSFLKDALMIFAVTIVFAMIGIVSVFLNNIWGILLGSLTYAVTLVAYFFLGKSDGIRCASLSHKKTADAREQKREGFSVWHAFRAPLIVAALPFALWLIVLITGWCAPETLTAPVVPEGAESVALTGAQKFAAILRMIVMFLSAGYSAIWTCSGFAFSTASFVTIAPLLVPMATMVLAYALGYLLFGMRTHAAFRDIEVEVGINRRG